MKVRSRIAMFGVVVGAVVLGATSALAVTPSSSRPKLYPSALTPAQVSALSSHANDRVIIVLRNQHTNTPGSIQPSIASHALASRASVLAADQAPIVSQLRSLKVPKMHAYSFLNAISATVSKSEAAQLATDPAVAAVVPDTVVQGPSSNVDLLPQSIAQTTSNPPVQPASGVCPIDPTKPLLEPEALSLMNVNFGPGSTQPSANSPAPGVTVDGTGVKLAVFPDGLDPNIPDFKTNDGAGPSAIFDYQDFTGEGTSAPTAGAEAFGDASSIISQGNDVFDLSDEVNPAHPLPTGCNIRIQGVAPGATLAVMKVFGQHNYSFDSEILDGLNYAVTVDHVDILSESFGGNTVSNSGNDPIALFDAAAAAAGITVVVSSGDAGTTNTIGTPATNPAVISVGATTQYQIYAQTSSFGYGYVPNTGGWISNEISSFSSSGTTEYGPRTIDVVAPGESGWADCSTDTSTFAECADQYNGSAPQPIEAFGGTSESCPLTAGVAALVIESYRNTHAGTTPAPALVKQIIMSSAQDISAPGDIQGAGLVDGLRAVQMAMSIDSPTATPPTSEGLLLSPSTIVQTAATGSPVTTSVSVTNTGSSAVHVTPALRVLGSPTTIASGNLTMSPSDPTFVEHNGSTVHGVHQLSFVVPSGTGRLVARLAWQGVTQPSSTIHATLLDPSGALAAVSRPQGSAGFSEDEIHNPAPGTWTWVIFAAGTAYAGPLSYSITGAGYHNASGTILPPSATVAPGASATFLIHTALPTVPGVTSQSVTFASTGGGPAEGTIPVTVSALVPVSVGHPGAFTGTVTGGNGRSSFDGQELVYQFNVPSGLKDIDADVTIAGSSYGYVGFLVDPNQIPMDAQVGSDNGSSETIHLSWADPAPGLWNLDLVQSVGATNSVLTSVPVTGTVSFNTVKVSSSGVINAGTVLAGTPIQATVTVTNTGNSPEAIAIDPRSNEAALYELDGFNSSVGFLPIRTPSDIADFIVPPFSSYLEADAYSSVPISFDMKPIFGSPDIGSSLPSNGDPNAAVAFDGGPDIPASDWTCGLAEIITSPEVSDPYTCGAIAIANSFDASVSSAAGDPWSDIVLGGSSFDFNDPVVQLGPGQTAAIPVTFTPEGGSGSQDTGFLAVETWDNYTFSPDILTTIPYSYTIGTCAAGLNAYVLDATGSNPFTGLFCVNSSGVGTYTQGSVSGKGSIKTTGSLTLISASGTGLALSGQSTGGSGKFNETSPMKETGSFTLIPGS